MLLAAAVLLTAGAIAYTLFVRERDLPPPVARTGYEHLEERREQIYENLRDLQFEYRVGKLSDADYQHTKQTLQAELASVLAEIDRIKAQAAAPAPPAPPSNTQCPHCGAKFARAMKFCGECGKAMSA
ncbi:MAG TPA: hypothetical protein VFA28_02415 [Bryobacteraceae bacterium]|jgi:hypothetical protein|nr:hypothetical protein [Bryobacteraceae bacterium]